MKEELKKPKNIKILSITIAIIGLIGSIITIYAFFMQTNKPNFECEIIDESNVFDINTDISNLNIIYKDNDLKQSGKSLKLLQIKFINNGTGDILINQFDPSYPITLKLINAEIVEKPEISNTSNDYLSSIIKVSTVDNRIVLPSFILDRNQFFVLKLLVLCDSSTNLNFEVSGKIAGQNEIHISHKISNNNNQTFIRRIFGGNILIQIVRAFVYTIFTVLAVISIGVSVSKTIDSCNRYNRKKNIKNFNKNSNTENSKINQIIFNYYIDDNFYNLRVMYKILTTEKDINEYYIKHTKQEKKNNSERFLKHDISYCKEMISLGLVISDNSVYRINEELVNLLKNFIEYIKIHNRNEYERSKNFLNYIYDK